MRNEVHKTIDSAPLDALPLHEEGLQLQVLRQDEVRPAHGQAREAGHALRGRVPGVQGGTLRPGQLRAERDQQFK